VPSGIGLELTVPALFVALGVTQVKGRPTLAAAVAGASVTALALDLPNGLGLLAGALAGAATGAIARRMS
jgi:predicted branched-subunit amino acid permease